MAHLDNMKEKFSALEHSLLATTVFVWDSARQNWDSNSTTNQTKEYRDCKNS